MLEKDYVCIQGHKEVYTKLWELFFRCLMEVTIQYVDLQLA